MFENRDTMRFQIQEMARVEKLVTDEDIQAELDIYNPLIPEPGQLCATSVPRAHERRPAARVAAEAGRHRAVVRDRARQRRPDPLSITDEAHAGQLTREEVTAAVHYIRFEFTPGAGRRVRRRSGSHRDHHPEYLEAVELSDTTHAELLGDLRP